MKRFFAFLLLGLTLSLGLSGLQNGISNQSVARVGATSASAVTTAFVTGQTLGTPGSGGIGYEVGYQINVGASPITVVSLARWVISGNTQTHAVKIYSDPFGTPTLVASVTVITSGQPVGLAYVNLGSPVTLTASTSYVVVQDEISTTDQSYDATTLTHTAVATIPNGVYRFGGTGTFGSSGSTDIALGFPGFKYQ